MVKIDLSAMQKTNWENNDNSQKSSNIDKKEEINLDKKNENQTISKKKISLNSLISSNWYSGENLKKTEKLVENDVKETEIIWKVEINLDKKEIIKEISLNNIIDLNADVKLEKQEKEEIIKTEEENKAEELVEKLKIADWDTIWTLIVDSKKEEIFWNYVSSFEKEIQAIKKKKESKIIKEEEKLEKKEIKEIKKDENNQNKEVEISHNDVNLDKILENIETKEIKKDKKININLDFLKNINKKFFKIIFIVVLFFSLSYWIWFLKTIIVPKNDIINNLPPINNWINNFENDKNKQLPGDHFQNLETKNPSNIPENIKNPPENDIYKTNNLEVKEKLIKYFKNKQINGNINLDN